MTLDRTAIIDRIKHHLEANTEPAFTVIVGEPLQLPVDGSPFACFWYLGNAEPPVGGMTLKKRMNVARYQVMCFWHRRIEIGALEPWEEQIQAADENLRTAFWGDFTLNGEVTDLDITDTTVDYGFFPLQVTNASQVLFRTLDFELQVRDLEGEPINA